LTTFTKTFLFSERQIQKPKPKTKTNPVKESVIQSKPMSSILHSAAAVPRPVLAAAASSAASFRPLFFPSGAWLNGKDKKIQFDIRARCVVSQSRPQEFEADVFQQNGSPVINWHNIVEDDIEKETLKVSISSEINKRVSIIKSMLASMEDGEINVSAYDTAWVALVKDVDGTGRPQFPESLDWISNNQLDDGSWGDVELFQAHDRLLNTLGCVVALTTWNLHPDKCARGMKFFNENLNRLEDENMEHMPIGFEVAFPSLLELARRLNLDVDHDSPVLKEIYAARDIKLNKIPKEILHNYPTTLLHSLEGMSNLDWEKLLKLQSRDGSFLFSPASTAYALSQTNDDKSLAYLSKMVQKFRGGVPNVYPVDLFENIWAIDRFQRLGISRYFQPEITKCVDYIEKYWDEKGICWARNSEVHDIDDTAMGFRILRTHGRKVSPDVFKYFEKNGEFFCFAGQSNQAITGLFNLYRASQVLFPGEEILENAKEYAYNFLREKQASDELLDKWIITKDLPGEVGYALDVPFYASLPRVESRFFIEQYGGEEDVWIGKTLYRMPIVNNNYYLELAKIDYNNCQTMHRMEWENLQKWYEESGVGEFGVSKRSLLQGYYKAAATVFEQDRSAERMAWAKTTALLEAIQSYFQVSKSKSTRAAFVHEFSHGIGFRSTKKTAATARHDLVKLLLGTLNHISLDALVADGRDIGHALRRSWEEWMLKWEEEGDRGVGEAELVVKTLNLAAGRLSSEEFLVLSHEDNNPLYHKLANLTNQICHQLVRFSNGKVSFFSSFFLLKFGSKFFKTPEIESLMQELVRLVTEKSGDDDEDHMKQTFLEVAKTFYYSAVCDPGTINHHIAKVLFERVH
ncbi:(-)-kolavenyl diphosphate synthase TPS28, chloroplastic, partial [Linum perenne]